METAFKPMHRSVGFSVLLRDKIQNYEIDDLESEFKFSDRLARENLWSKDFTKRVIKEYKRFMFLAAFSRKPVTPSLEVDEVWHLHMLYTRQYNEFCKLLGGFIHHGPTKGGKKEDNKYIDLYESTKKSYFMWFSEMPPEDIWPSSNVRFRRAHFARVDLTKHWVIPVGNWRAYFKIIWYHLKQKIKQL